MDDARGTTAVSADAAGVGPQQRPWGQFECLEIGERFQVKRLSVNPGARLSLQRHYHRAEHWVIVRGTALVTCGDDVRLLAENQVAYIPLGAVHRLENPGKLQLELIEVQCGPYLREDDIVRLEDDHGRAPAPPADPPHTVAPTLFEAVADTAGGGKLT